MSEDTRWGHVELDVNVGRAPRVPVPETDTPFRILVLGDLSGRGHRPASAGRAPLAARRPIRVDRDSVDEALARLEPDIVLPRGSGDDVTVRIRELDDFHPDRLFDALPLFRSLRELRRRLADPTTCADAARELIDTDTDPAHAPRGVAEETARPVAPGHVLEAILGGPLDEGDGAGPSSGDELRDFIRRSVAPHLVPAGDPRASTLMQRVDSVIADAMRALLHHRSFQALESVWRGVTTLTSRLETGERLQLWLLDVSIPELVADAAPAADPAPSALSRIIVDGAAEGGAHAAQPWALIVSAFTFGWDDADLVVLRYLASIARRALAPVIAGAAPRLVGTPSFDRVSDPAGWSRDAIPAWEEFRRSSDARFVGLVAPRFLARVPYGEQGEPCEQFDFEELTASSTHADFLWANGAFACAELLGQSFGDAGWRLRPGMHRDFDRLPYWTVQGDGGASLQPCAEMLLTERAANHMMERGVMPLASVKGSDVALLVRFQSVANPVAPLAGKWVGAAGEGA